MSFLAPITALIAAAIAIPALVALYFLKLRRRQMVVASTLLWKKAVQDMQVNAPFQRLRKNLLLLLQLLLLAALLLAMARPTTQSIAAPGQRVIIVIDHSASMNATDGDSSGAARLQEAKRTALQLIDAMGAGEDGAVGDAMVVSFAQQARVVQSFTGDLARLRDAVRRIEPTDERSRLGAALRLIEPFAMQAQATATAADGESLVVYVLSDGRIHHDQGQTLALSGARLNYIRIGQPAADHANVGFVSFSARRDFERPQIVQVFARLSNDGDQPLRTNVTLRLDGQVQRVQAVSLPPRRLVNPDRAPGGEAIYAPGEQSLQYDFVLAGAAMVELSHDHDDALGADDAVRLMLAPARRLRVLLVTTGNAFLERVIRSVGVRDLVVMTPDKYEDQNPQHLRRGGWDPMGSAASAGAAEGFDAIVFDRYAPQAPPPVSSVSFGAAPPLEGLKLVSVAPADASADSEGEAGADEAGEGGAGEGEAADAVGEAQVILDWDRDHPLMRYVVLDDVILGRAGRLVVPADATILAVGQHGPIMAEVRADGRRHVVTSFDILETNWPLYVSFPVFISNAVQTLGLGGLYDQAGLAYTTGQVAVAPVMGASDHIRYSGPVDLTATVSNGAAVLPVFPRVGVYETGDDVDPPYDRIPVNLLDPLESDLWPAATLEVGASAVEGTSQTRAVRREVWHWFIWAGLALLMIEWLVYTRRMHL